MVSTDLVEVTVSHPDGMIERWFVPANATPESLIAAGVQLLRLAGLDVVALHVDDEFGRMAAEAAKDRDNSEGDRNPASGQMLNDDKPSTRAGDPEPNPSAAPKESVKPRGTPSREQMDRTNRLRREKRQKAKQSAG